MTAPNDPPSGDQDPGNGRPDGNGTPTAWSLAAVEQTLADGDQTLSDGDQTSSDNDQTSADTDQAAADEDQAAADHDLAFGLDPQLHEVSRGMRERSARRRELTARARIAEAEKRDLAAQARDLAAAARDRAADARDEMMLRHDAAALDDTLPRSAAEVLMRAGDHRRRAREQRALAATHRDDARQDRQAAAEDRRQAARERASALADREALMHELELAATDPLTGAKMRAAGLRELETEIVRSRRTGVGLNVAYVDVIGLKACNDTHGHAAGDELLKRVVTAIRQHVRTYDLVIRLGGDEFLCAMPGATLPEIHERFRKVAVALADGEPAEITAGFAELQPGETAEELIARADADLMAHRRNAPGARDEPPGGSR